MVQLGQATVPAKDSNAVQPMSIFTHVNAVGVQAIVEELKPPRPIKETLDYPKETKQQMQTPAVTMSSASLPVQTTEHPIGLSSSSSTTTTMETIVTRHPCDIECTKLEYIPVCATNAECYFEFANSCVLNAYNCRHPSQQFMIESEQSCSSNAKLRRCRPQDLKDE